MDSVIEALYNGEIRASEMVVPKHPEYSQLCRKIGEEKKYFTGKMDEDDRLRFQELDDMQMRIGSMMDKALFAYGMRLGARFMAEMLGDWPEF